MTSAIARLHEFGQSPWLDNLTRPLITEGGLQRLLDEDGIRGVTSNPTIFEKAMGTGHAYDAELVQCAKDGLTIEESYWRLVADDVGHAADILKPVYDQTGGADGFVSIEVSPDLAHDTKGTLAQAAELFKTVGRKNIFIKIPATEEGIPAIEANLAAGINTNITLIFALDRYRQVMEAFLSGMERFVAGGGDASTLASVASFFVSRVDTETDRRLPEGHALRGKAGVANAKLAYELFQQRFAEDRWRPLAAKGARVQRPLWASTSTKNPAYSPTLYVDDLIGRDTVNTLAQASIDALHKGDGKLRADTVTEDVDGARTAIAGLADAGVDFTDVTDTLEREGVASFSTSIHDCFKTLEKKRAELT
ncbi:MAG TPA: transaldolase [Acidimicrobiia bacterium]